MGKELYQALNVERWKMGDIVAIWGSSKRMSVAYESHRCPQETFESTFVWIQTFNQVNTQANYIQMQFNI